MEQDEIFTSVVPNEPEKAAEPIVAETVENQVVENKNLQVIADSSKGLVESNSSLLGVSVDKNIHFEMDKSKAVSEQAADIVDLAATMKAVDDEKLVDDITSLKKEELLTGAQNKVKNKTVENKEAEKKLQEANYGIYEGIAQLIGLKKPLPNKMLQVLMTILMPILIVYYVIMGTITGIINVTMDCINTVVNRFAEFTKPAKKIILCVLIAAVVGAIILVIKALLVKYGIVKW